jgi:hypothetical protein
LGEKLLARMVEKGRMGERKVVAGVPQEGIGLNDQIRGKLKGTDVVVVYGGKITGVEMD